MKIQLTTILMSLIFLFRVQTRKVAAARKLNMDVVLMTSLQPRAKTLKAVDVSHPNLVAVRITSPLLKDLTMQTVVVTPMSTDAVPTGNQLPGVRDR